MRWKRRSLSSCSDLTDERLPCHGRRSVAAQIPIDPNWPASFSGLNVDEQIDLVALTWLGRGDGGARRTGMRLRAQAAQAHNNRTATYLIETPMLGDYLEEALSEFGLSLEDFEESL